MQPPLMYSWIALTASAPVILLTCWTLAIFQCRRRQWGTMDIFLVAILSQSIFQQFLGFVYSTLVLLKLSTPLTGEAVCTGMMWFFIVIPIFKGTTITSLAVDRWLFYTRFSYQLSIRKNHVRYHIAVLAILACLVGFTALITFNNPELLVGGSSSISSSSSSSSWLAASSSSPQYSFDQCTFLPFKFDLKFVIFYLSVHCIVVLVGVIVLCKTLCHKNNSNSSQLLPHTKKFHYKRRRSSPPIMDVTPTVSNTSTASSTISNSSPTAFFSTPGLSAKAVLSNSPNNAFFHHPQQQGNFTSSRDFSDRLRDRTTAEDNSNSRLYPAISLLCLTILCTHLPFTIATILSRMEILVPIASIGFGSGDILSPTNWPVTNLLLWLQVVEGLTILLILFIVDNVVPTWIFNRESKKSQKLPAHHHHHSYAIEDASNIKAETSFNPQTNLNNRTGGGGGGNNGHYTNHAFTPDFKNNRFPITNGSLFAGLSAAASSTSGVIRPVMPMPSVGQTGHGSNNNGCFQQSLNGQIAIHRQARNDFDSIGAVFQEDESEYDRKSYHHRYSSVASVTTVANDDFEFHQSRPAKSQPLQQRPLPIPNKDFNPSTYVVPKSQSVPPPHPVQTFNMKKISDKEKIFKQNQHIYEEFESRKKLPIMRTHLTGGGQPTSLSMNDLDLIDDRADVPLTIVTGTTEPFEHKQRMYRKRTRVPPSPHHHHPSGRFFNDRRVCQKPISDQFSDSSHRRVLSMECLSPSNKQTEHRNFLDISYLDTGEILVRKADSSKCIFVTDFI